MDRPTVDAVLDPFVQWLEASGANPSTAYQYLIVLRRLFLAAETLDEAGFAAVLVGAPIQFRARCSAPLRQYAAFVASATRAGVAAALPPGIGAAAAAAAPSTRLSPATKPTKPAKPTIPPNVASALLKLTTLVEPQIQNMRFLWSGMAGTTSRKMSPEGQTLERNKINWRRFDMYDVLAISTWENIRQTTIEKGPAAGKKFTVFEVAGLRLPIEPVEPHLEAFAQYGGFTAADPAPRPLLPKFPRSVEPFSAKELRKLVPEVIRAEEQQRLVAGNG